MSKPQSGIFNESSQKFYFLEYSLLAPVNVSSVKACLKQLLADKLETVELVLAFGPKAWHLLEPEWQPDVFNEFTTLNGAKGYSAPSTQQDILLWIHSNDHDLNFDQAMMIQNLLSDFAKLTLQVPGFSYHESKDLIGFVDGTANPKDDDRKTVALIPEGKTGAGGAYVMSQKWVHQLEKFKGLPVRAQEEVVGRTREDNIELEGDAMPHNSHVSRTDVKVDGKAIKIYRRSAPYGDVLKKGLYFLAFAAEQKNFDIQLQRMFGLSEDGVHDRLIEFSAPQTGSYWFAPSQEDLNTVLA